MFAYYLDLALRSLKRNRMLTALMVLAIAVGIGASMTTLTVMHLLSGDPLPGKSAHLFYAQVDAAPDSKKREPYDVLDYQSAVDLWSAKRADRQTLIADSQIKVHAPEANQSPLMLMMLSTTSDFFPMFDVPFQYGHAWGTPEDAASAAVAVISGKLNDKLFGGRDSSGRMLRVGGHALRIIGGVLVVEEIVPGLQRRTPVVRLRIANSILQVCQRGRCNVRHLHCEGYADLLPANVYLR